MSTGTDGSQILAKRCHISDIRAKIWVSDVENAVGIDRGALLTVAKNQNQKQREYPFYSNLSL
jgi:hypothetical protein